MSTKVDSLPYKEPSITTILVLSSFVLLLNIVNHLLNATIYCGLVGQVFIGIFWGAPLGNLLTTDTQHVVVSMGYIGLVLLVYEGGLNTNLKSLTSNLPLSIAVAMTGIICPIALSFLLEYITPTTKKQCFTAGAALSATSLGTTFTILSTAGMVNTRLGSVLTSAAMMDDVVGLIIVDIVGGDASIVRTIGASLGLILAVPILTWVLNKVIKKEIRLSKRVIWGSHTAILVTSVTVAAYAGASVLLAAFLVGTAVAWWDTRSFQRTDSNSNKMSGIKIYEDYYLLVVNRLLKPFFFASIGFSIPITRMFGAAVVWKGIVYSVLMVSGKALTGLWLIHLSLPFKISNGLSRFKCGCSNSVHVCWKNLPCAQGIIRTVKKPTQQKPVVLQALNNKENKKTPDTTPNTTIQENSNDGNNFESASITMIGNNNHQSIGQDVIKTSTLIDQSVSDKNASDQKVNAKLVEACTLKPARSLYPPAIMGLAMVARGEIAFLIASIANSKGVYTDELYLIVIWAAVVCTIIGPLCAGLVVKRVKKLETERSATRPDQSVLGVWGVL